MARLEATPLTGGKEGESVVEMRRDFLHGQHIHPGAGEFQRQRQPIQPPADIDHCFRIARRQLKRGFSSLRPFDKQTNGIVVEQAVPRYWLRGIGEAQRRDAHDHFAVKCERLAAGHKQRQVWAARQQEGGDAGAFLNHMFTVVQHQQQVPRMEKRAKSFEWREIRRLGQREHIGDGLDHQV